MQLAPNNCQINQFLLNQIILLEKFDIFIHCDHAVLLTSLHNSLDLDDLRLTDQVRNRRNADHHLECADTSAAAALQRR